MKGARLLVFPSICYENFPFAIAEAFACGLPVASPDDGVSGELVEDGVTGAHFHAADPESLADVVSRLWANPSMTREMGMRGRAVFEANYTAERNWIIMREIYSRLGQNRQ